MDYDFYFSRHRDIEDAAFQHRVWRVLENASIWGQMADRDYKHHTNEHLRLQVMGADDDIKEWFYAQRP